MLDILSVIFEYILQSTRRTRFVTRFTFFMLAYYSEMDILTRLPLKLDHWDMCVQLLMTWSVLTNTVGIYLYSYVYTVQCRAVTSLCLVISNVRKVKLKCRNENTIIKVICTWLWLVMNEKTVIYRVYPRQIL